MSSVAVQFLIYVLTPNCLNFTCYYSLTGCLEVQVNVPITFTLYAMNYCNKTKSVITDLLPTADINGIQVSNLVNSTTNITNLCYTHLDTSNKSNWSPNILCGCLYKVNTIFLF